MSNPNTPTPPLSLQALADLPLHRQVWSAALADSSGRLCPVGGITAKDRAAHRAGLRALGVAQGQTLDNGEALAARSPSGLPVDQADTLQQALALAQQRNHRELYGSITELPDMLRWADAAGTPDPNASFDYTQNSYFGFDALNELIDQGCLRAPAQDKRLPGTEPPDQGSVLSDGEPLKLMNRGYLFILGTAGCGKTSFALEWVRHSQAHSLRPPAADQRPRLAGWYFARRYSTDGSGAGQIHLDEYRALQTWLAMARRQRDVLPQDGAAELLDRDELNTYTQKRGSSEWFKQEDTLRERFRAGLQHLASAASAADPLVLLLDGADEMWAPGPQSTQVRHAFPRLLPLPQDLPEHVYIVILSRPGAHMEWSRAQPPVQPILQYTFQQERVAQFIQAYLQQQAQLLKATDLQAAELLQDPQLQRHIAQASEGAFGYAALLLRPWLRPGLDPTLIEHRLQQLERWRDAPGSLPRGVYNLRARDLLDADQGLEQELAREPELNGHAFQCAPPMSVKRLLATLAVLRGQMTQEDLLERWSSQTSDPQQLRLALKHAFRAAAPFLAGGASDGVLQFGHQSLAEVALAAWRLSPQGQPSAYSEATGEHVAALAQYMVDQRLQRFRIHRKRTKAAANASNIKRPEGTERSNPTEYSDEELMAADARLLGQFMRLCE